MATTVNDAVLPISLVLPLTGETVTLEIIPETDYVTNSLDALRSRLRGESAPDVFVSGPVSMWKLAGEGIVEPLDPFLDTCSDDYRPDDFPGARCDGPQDIARRSSLPICGRRLVRRVP